MAIRGAGRAAGVRAREVKRPENAREVLAFDKRINGTPRGEWRRCDVDGVAAHRPVEIACYSKERVARRLEIEPAAIHAPQKFIPRIGLQVRTDISTALLVGRGEHYEAVQFFDRPSITHEARGEIIQEFRVRGRI